MVGIGRGAIKSEDVTLESEDDYTMGFENTRMRKTGVQNKKICWIIVGFLLASCVAQARSDSACAISLPEGWVQSAVRWDGTCHAGVADGLGVLKEFSGKNVKRLFFGLVKNGELMSGVIDQQDGYIAGSFERGRRVQSEDRQTVISAFDKAAAAAEEAAKRFEKAGNKASSRFYQAKAKSLQEQLD
jgi:hypothetical protein